MVICAGLKSSARRSKCGFCGYVGRADNVARHERSGMCLRLAEDTRGTEDDRDERARCTINGKRRNKRAKKRDAKYAKAAGVLAARNPALQDGMMAGDAEEDEATEATAAADEQATFDAKDITAKHRSGSSKLNAAGSLLRPIAAMFTKVLGRFFGF